MPSSGFARVIDGDTLRLNGERIRLIGIDAPEMAQTCKTATGRTWLCGQAARERLAVLASRGKAYCVAQGRDRYGRTLAACSSPGAGDFGETLVREGLALSYYGNTYLLAELSARAKGRGCGKATLSAPATGVA